ncbi:MAG TPA: BadF/BadG/BcrA/BcrD ATPase family protein [Myxococcota bacterium]|nr:BadF/BadG/BcrA/BcrD ATPase family protein [Myxococcota bacterium]
MALYLGVDAGGSHCRARLTDESGKVLGTGTSGPANTRMGIEPLHARLLETCAQATTTANLAAGDIAKVHVGMGIAGINRMGAKAKLRALPFPFASLSLTSDAVIANLGAHLGADGATLILGTGSVGIIKLGEDSISIGGYGFPISDEGSGAALGLSAIRHALRALDGRSRSTPLSQEVTRQFDHVTARMVAWMDEATPADYATFAPLVMDYAENGDEIARSIVSEAAGHVERFIETIYARGATRLSLAGGLSSRMRPWLRARIVDKLSPPLGDPLDGALLLAGRPSPTA